MAAYAGTTTMMFRTVFGNKAVSLLKVDITNYNATGIPLTELIAGLDNIEAVIPFFTGDLDVSGAPVVAAYQSASDVVFLFNAADTDVADDFNCNTNSILVYLLVIGT